MKDTQQWVTERSHVPGLSFMMDRFQTLDLAEFIRKGYNSFKSSDKA